MTDARSCPFTLSEGTPQAVTVKLMRGQPKPPHLVVGNLLARLIVASVEGCLHAQTTLRMIADFLQSIWAVVVREGLDLCYGSDGLSSITPAWLQTLVSPSACWLQSLPYRACGHREGRC